MNIQTNSGLVWPFDGAGKIWDVANDCVIENEPYTGFWAFN